jgi:hypothetical protein
MLYIAKIISCEINSADLYHFLLPRLRPRFITILLKPVPVLILLTESAPLEIEDTFFCSYFYLGVSERNRFELVDPKS